MVKVISLEEINSKIAELEESISALKKTRDLMFKDSPDESSAQLMKSNGFTADDFLLQYFAYSRDLTLKQAVDYLKKQQEDKIFKSKARNMGWVAEPALKRLVETGKIQRIGGKEENPIYRLI